MMVRLCSVPSGDANISGLHLTPAGYKIMYEEVLKVIGQNWPDQTPVALKSLRDLHGLKFWYEVE